MIKQAVILCAGKGTRLGELTKSTPKPLLKVEGKPFVEYAIDKLISVGVRDIILVVEYLKQEFKYLQIKYPIVVRFWDDQEDTNKAVLSVPYLHPRFLLLNGDCYPIMDWKTFLKRDYIGVCIQPNKRDAGCAVVSGEWIRSGILDCTKVSRMLRIINRFPVEGNLSIDTPEKLEMVREYVKAQGI